MVRIGSEVSRWLCTLTVNVLPLLVRLQSWLNVQIFDLDLRFLVLILRKVLIKTFLVDHGSIPVTFLALDLPFPDCIHALLVDSVDFLQVSSFPACLVFVCRFHKFFPMLKLLIHLLLDVLLVLEDLFLALCALLLLVQILLHSLHRVVKQVPPCNFLPSAWMYIELSRALDMAHDATQIICCRRRGYCRWLTVRNDSRIFNDHGLRLRWSSCGLDCITSIRDPWKLTVYADRCIFGGSHTNKAPLQLREDVALCGLRNASLRVDIVLQLMLQLHVFNFCFLDFFRALHRFGDVWSRRVSPTRRLILKRVVWLSHLLNVQL